eukprot:3931615-Rhodomonas_salina.1
MRPVPMHASASRATINHSRTIACYAVSGASECRAALRRKTRCRPRRRYQKLLSAYALATRCPVLVSRVLRIVLYVLPMRCPVLVVLRACYAMPGTAIEDIASRLL